MKKCLIMLCMLLGCYSISFAETYEVTAYTHTGNVMANGEYPYVGAVASNDFPYWHDFKYQWTPLCC